MKQYHYRCTATKCRHHDEFDAIGPREARFLTGQPVRCGWCGGVVTLVAITENGERTKLAQ